MFGWLKKREKPAPDMRNLIAADDVSIKISAGHKADIFRIVYNSQLMEGSSLSLPEAKETAFSGMAPNREKSLRDAYDLYGNFKTWQSLLDHLDSNGIDRQSILDAHADALAGESHAGKLRIFPAFIGSIEPPKAEDISGYLDSLCSIFPKLEIHPVARAAYLHMALFAIHPFRDGNRRTSRMLMNASLALSSYPPILIDRTNYDDYWNALEDGRQQKRSAPFLKWVCVELAKKPVGSPRM